MTYKIKKTIKITIYSDKKVQICLLFNQKNMILAKYLDFRNIFSKKLAKVLFQCIKANKPVIILKKYNQLYHVFIYR